MVPMLVTSSANTWMTFAAAAAGVPRDTLLSMTASGESHWGFQHTLSECKVAELGAGIADFDQNV